MKNYHAFFICIDTFVALSGVKSNSILLVQQEDMIKLNDLEFK